MRNLWLLIAFLVLLPVMFASLKLSGGLDWSVVETLWIPIPLALLATAAVQLLPRLANWHHGSSRRHH